METLKPGREMDALVAEKVMGHKYPSTNQFEPGPSLLNPLPYSTDIAAAWEVVEKMRTYGYRIDLSEQFPEGKYYVCQFQRSGNLNYQAGYTASHAICLAALKAVGAL